MATTKKGKRLEPGIWKHPDGQGYRSGTFRIKLTPQEINDVRATMRALDEFYGLCRVYESREAALAKLSNEEIRGRVREYNRELPDQAYCPAAFLGGHLESLSCGNAPAERCEWVSDEPYEP